MGKWGFVDYENNAVIGFQYDDVHSFSDGLAPVQKDGKWGFIDKDNNTVVDFQYDVAYGFSEGKSVVGHYKTIEYSEYYTEELLSLGFVTTDGVYTPFNFSFDLSFDPVPSEAEFTNGVISFVCDSRRDGAKVIFFHDSNGAFIASFGAYTETTYPANEGLIPIQDNLGWKYRLNLGGWMDMDGNIVHQYEVEYFGPEYEREDEWGWTYTDQSRRWIYWVGPFTNGLAPAWQATYNAETGETTDLMGFIDRATFDWAIEPQFTSHAYAFGDNVGPYAVFVNGLAMVTKDGKRGAIDKSGRTVIPFQYESMLAVTEGRIAFQEDGKWGYLSASAPYEVVIPARYEQATMFLNGLAVVYDGTNAFLIDWYGNPVPGADSLDPSTYFKEDGKVYSPEEYVVLERDGLYGIGHIEYLPELPEKTAMHGWAYDEVAAAIEEDLVPVDLQNLYRTDITRMEFCRVMVQSVEAALGQDIAEVVQEKTGRRLSDWQNEYLFNDTSSSDVIAACALGIVEGTDDDTFTPYKSIARQEAAVMLTRAAKLVGVDAAGVEGTVFADTDRTSSWAVEAVGFVSHYGIMEGKDNDMFDPRGTFTREQSYITALRLVQAAKQ